MVASILCDCAIFFHILSSMKVMCQVFVAKKCYVRIEISLHIFGKSSSTKFYQNLSSGSRIVPCGGRRTDRHDKANRRLSQIFESACEVNSSIFDVKEKVVAVRT
jgi:hypothetical protein